MPLSPGTTSGYDIQRSGVPSPPLPHAPTHIHGGTDEIDGDRLDIDYVPTCYTPDPAGGGVTSTQELAAHLAGINDALCAAAVEKLQSYGFTLSIAVPNAGTAFCDFGQVATSAAPMTTNHAGSFRGASIRVDVVDLARSYELRFQKNGVTVETLALPSGTLRAATSTFTTALAVTDDIAVLLVRTAGVGKSTFRNASITLVLQEA